MTTSAGTSDLDLQCLTAIEARCRDAVAGRGRDVEGFGGGFGAVKEDRIRCHGAAFFATVSTTQFEGPSAPCINKGKKVYPTKEGIRS